MLAETATTERMVRGNPGTARTIELMHKLVAKAKLDPTMHRIATWIRNSVPSDRRGSTRATADAIFNWVKRHGLFQRDQFQCERIEHPISSMQSLIKLRQNGIDTHGKLFAGDCDQFAIWVASLGGILGFQYAFETSKSDLRRPDEWSHVWSSLLVGPDWVAYDASTPGATPNWRPPMASKDQFKRWPEKPVEEVGVAGLGDDEDVPFMVPEDYFGYGIEHEGSHEIKPDVAETDPGRLDMLVPEEPVLSKEDLSGKYPLIQRVRVPGPDERPSLVPTFESGPRRAELKQAYYKVIRRRFPKGSLWNRIAVSDEDRAPRRRDGRILESVSTVPAAEVTPAMTGPITVTQESGSMNVVRRPGLKTTVIVQRPQVTPAGVGEGEDDWRSGLVVNMEQAQAQQAGASTLDTIAKTIASVTAAVAPSIAQVQLAKINDKYQGVVANAVNSVTGFNLQPNQITPTRVGGIALTAPGAPVYKQPWLWMALGVISAGTVAVMVLKPAKRRSRGRR